MMSKRLAITICAVTFLGVIGFLVTSSHSAPASIAAGNGDCVGCGQTKVKVELTGDPDGDKAAWTRAIGVVKQIQAATDAKAAAKHLARFEAWHGTELSVRDTVADQGTVALHQAVCNVFSADPAAPAARANEFQKLLAPGSMNRCAGYYGSVESVTPNADGWLAVVKVSPKLVSKTAAVVFTPFACVEEWQIGKDSSLRNLSCKADPNTLRIIMTD